MSAAERQTPQPEPPLDEIAGDGPLLTHVVPRDAATGWREAGWRVIGHGEVEGRPLVLLGAPLPDGLSCWDVMALWHRVCAGEVRPPEIFGHAH